MKNLLLLFFLLNSGLVFSQNINLKQLLLFQKQDFNKSNNFFINNNWQAAKAKNEKNSSNAYTALWEKGELPNIQGCRITYYDRIEGNEEHGAMMTQVSYSFTKKETYDNLKNEIEKSGYKATKPIIENGIAYSSYTDGNCVVGIGVYLKNPYATIYSVKIENYVGYYIKQKE